MEQELVTLAIGEDVHDPYGGVYRVEELLGKERSEAAYLVRDKYFKQHLFVLREFIEPDARARARLIREGERFQQISRRASPRIYGVFEDIEHRRVYILMDYVTGQRLADLRKVHSFPATSEFIRRLPSTEPRLEAARIPVTGQRKVFGVTGPKRREMLLILALALLVGAIIGISFFVFLARSPGRSPVTHRTGPSPGSPSPMVTHLSSIYPRLATAYAGTAVDLLNSEKTAMYLSGVQQNQNGLSGEFQGLGLTGPFTGTVTRSGHVQFIVNVKSNQEILSFDGDIKIGGDIAGSFVVQNQQGEKTGESGVWNIAASS